MLQLTSQNYHSIEANREYMSNSLYGHFIECEERAMAILNGSWAEDQSESLLVGSYVHAALEGDEAFAAFVEQNYNLIYNSKDKKYAAFVQADKMIDTIRNDAFAMFVLQGQSEVIITAEFSGTMWKAKLDRYNPEAGRFADIKTVRSIREKYWDKQYGWVSFVEAYGYCRQMALYAELERIHAGRDEWLEPLIVAVSKEDPPDKAVIGFDTERLQMELEEVQRNMPRILAVKSGLEVPRRCETCRYCRETKRLTRVIHYMDLLA
jgi:hypothetical protein